MVLLSILVIVLAERIIALLPVACFVPLQQVLAVSMHHVPSSMVLLSIPKIVLAEQVIALLPVACFVPLQQWFVTLEHASLQKILAVSKGCLDR
tara:strand:+ start:239 stop:520 length:282 start_codon:yes stop_codon:yes gene_type:complete